MDQTGKSKKEVVDALNKTKDIATAIVHLNE
jgi:NACalpha-BTF3-like transcription factor